MSILSLARRAGSIISVVVMLSLPATTAPATQKMPTPTGRVIYKMSGPMNVTITMLWSESGRKFRQESKTQMPAGRGRQSMNMDSWTISDGTYLYRHTGYMGKKVMRMKMPKEILNAAQGSKMLMGAGVNQGKVIGRANVLGKPCEIRQVSLNNQYMKMRSKAWLWQGLPLRAETTMQMSGARVNTRPGQPKPPQMRNMKMSMIATSLDTRPRLSAALFKVPAGYIIQDTPTSNRRSGMAGNLRR